MLTAAEIAAFLGVTPGRVRQIVSKHAIPRRGRRGRAPTYDVREVVRHTGVTDRLAS